MRVVELPDRARFALEPCGKAGRRCHGRLQDLDRNGATETGIEPLVDGAEAAGADDFLKLIRP